MHRRFAPTLRVLFRRSAILRVVALAAAGVTTTAGLRADRVTLDFNPDWRFAQSDPTGVPAAVFDDQAWAVVSAPHTFNDTDTFDDFSLPNHRGEQNQWSGRTWYRKTFRTAGAWKGKKVFLEFEAARQVAEVYCNGRLLGTAKTGFTPFGFDLTPWLRAPGETNVVAVMVDNRFMKDLLELPPEPGRERRANLKDMLEEIEAGIPASVEELRADQIPWNNPHWHPAHGGLYRNVRLHVTDPLHVTLPLFSFLQTEGPYAYATRLDSDAATVGIDVPVRNDRKADAAFEVRAEIFDADNRSVLTARTETKLAAGASAKFSLGGTLARPRFWQPDYPHVYRVVCELRQGGATVDTAEIPLGLRRAEWSATSGLTLNGRPLKLHGWGQKPTDEWPGLGAAQPDWLHAYTLALMREGGGNFVRWGHCAAGPAMIDAGDRLGIVAIQPGVDGEKEPPGGAWLLRAQAFRDTVIYFRNHPSILVWEGGNQKLSRDHAAELHGYVEQYDPHGGRAYAHRRADPVTAKFMDVGIGTEGSREIASLAVVEGEYNREESPRRVWDDFSPPNFGYPEAKGQTYQLTSEQFAVNQVKQYVGKLGAPDHGGGANWIFSDTTSGGRVGVEVARASGEVDGVRLPKEAYHVLATLWRDGPQVHIVGHWNYPANTRKTVYVVANGDEVELFVNGRPVGRRQPTDGFLFAFPDVAFESGEIKAVAVSRSRPGVSQVKQTAGAPAALRLTAITGPDGLRADGSDVVLVDVEAVDAEGRRCPTFQRRVDFTMVGAGVWRGGYNSGQPGSTNVRHLDLEAGINRVAIRATGEAGEIVLRATCPGLQAGGVTVAARHVRREFGAVAEPIVRPAARLPEARPEWNFFPPETEATPTAPTAEKTPVAAAPTIAAPPAVAPIAPETPAPRPDPVPAAVPAIAAPPKVFAPTSASSSGRYTRAVSYTGPNAAIVHVETAARDGRNAYADVDSPFAALPVALNGADWLQAANGDALYHAVDLVELAVPAGTRVFVAHDDRLPRPPWLLAQFRDSGLKVHVLGKKMTLFTKPIGTDTSLTLGPNTESTAATEANMYLVFVNRAE